MNTITRFLAAALLAAVVLGAMPETTLAQSADPERGKTLAYTCLGCHGIRGYRNAYPSYRVPKLGGQHAEYMVNALKAYQSGERSHATMRAQAASLSEQDMRDIAAYLSTQRGEVTLKPSGMPAPAAAATCTACHGDKGISLSPEWPNLAGQHEDYLVDSLLQYQKKTVSERNNAIMLGLVTTLTEQDIAEIAKYYASQQALYTTK